MSFRKNHCSVIMSVPSPRFVDGEDMTVHCDKPKRYELKEDPETGDKVRVYFKWCDEHKAKFENRDGYELEDSDG